MRNGLLRSACLQIHSCIKLVVGEIDCQLIYINIQSRSILHVHFDRIIAGSACNLHIAEDVINCIAFRKCFIDRTFRHVIKTVGSIFKRIAQIIFKLDVDFVIGLVLFDVVEQRDYIPEIINGFVVAVNVGFFVIRTSRTE